MRHGDELLYDQHYDGRRVLDLVSQPVGGQPLDTDERDHD
jgi:hypothetical protein